MKYIDQFLSKMKEKNIVVNYIQIYQGNKIIEEYARMNTKTRLNVYSVSKSVTSIAIGIAMDEGLLSLDDYIYQFFDEIDYNNCDDYVKEIKIIDLLTMTCGLKNKLFFSDDAQRYIEKDWVSYFFYNEFAYKPGTHFDYSNFNTYILSCIIEKVSKQSLLDYLKPRLFEPLGIGNPNWLACPMGHTMAANSLMLTIDEMTKIGVLLLQEGNYQGKQLVSKEYLKLATKNQIKNEIPKFGYGFQFWINKDLQSYRADGKYGQYIIVVPKSNLVVTMQALDTTKFYDDVWEDLVVPIIEKSKG